MYRYEFANHTTNSSNGTADLSAQIDGEAQLLFNYSSDLYRNDQQLLAEYLDKLRFTVSSLSSDAEGSTKTESILFSTPRTITVASLRGEDGSEQFIEVWGPRTELNLLETEVVEDAQGTSQFERSIFELYIRCFSIVVENFRCSYGELSKRVSLCLPAELCKDFCQAVASENEDSHQILSSCLIQKACLLMLRFEQPNLA